MCLVSRKSFMASMPGIGRLHGIEAMNDFLETKHIYLEAES